MKRTVLTLIILVISSCIPITYSYPESYGIKGQLINEENRLPINLIELSVTITTEHGSLDEVKIDTDEKGFFELKPVYSTKWTIANGGPILLPATHQKIELSGTTFETVILHNSDLDLGIISVKLK